MNVVREVQSINEAELRRGIDGSMQSSWHADFASSAWVYVGGLGPELTEGDVACVLSQWGEVEDLHLVRDELSGRSKGFCFVKYEDRRSAILCVDNMNGTQLLGRTLRVDHKLEYVPPRATAESDSDQAAAAPGGRPLTGRAYADRALADGYTLQAGIDVFATARAGAAASRAPALATALSARFDPRSPAGAASSAAASAATAAAAAPAAAAAAAPTGDDDAWRGRYANSRRQVMMTGSGPARSLHAAVQGGQGRLR